MKKIQDINEWGEARKFPRLLTLSLSCKSGAEANRYKELLIKELGILEFFKEYGFTRNDYKFKVVKVEDKKQGKKMVYKVNKGKGL